jgi:dolichol-phosphate mannosyltransferase
MPKAIIIIPTYNEAKTIEKTLFAIDDQQSKLPQGWKLEVLIVDDSSPDGTAKVVEKVAQKLSYVKLFSNSKKSGLGGAYLRGMEQAFYKHGADVVFEFDADLSHDPKRIPEFLTKIDQGYDMVLGSRYIRGGSIPDDWGLHRKFLSVFGNIFIMAVLTDFRIRDWTTGYRAIKKEVYESVKDELTGERFSGYTFQIGFLHKAVRKGFKIAEVPLNFIDRTEGESKLGTEYIKNTLMYILKVRIKELLNHRAFKFVMVGGIGALIQLSSLHFYRYLIPVDHFAFMTKYQEAYLLSVETAIVSNFILSNLWTFADRKLELIQIPLKFIQFNLASAGSIIIQLILATLGEKYIGLFTVFTLPIVNISFDTGFFFAIMGILVGMFWNFFAYSKIVWRKK